MAVVKPGKCYAKNPATCRFHTAVTFEQQKSLAEEVFSVLAKVLIANASPDDTTGFNASYLAELNQHTVEELEEYYSFVGITPGAVYDTFSVDDINKYNKLREEQQKKLTNDEKDTLDSYTRALYDMLHTYLTNPERIKPTRTQSREFYLDLCKKHIGILDGIFESKVTKFKEPRTVYRVLMQDYGRDEDGNSSIITSSEDYAKRLGFTPGRTVEMKTYMSTSADPGFVNRKFSHGNEHTDVVLIFETSEGVIASDEQLPFNSEGGHIQSFEREILLNRNKRFKVKKVERAAFTPATSDDETRNPLAIYLEEIKTPEK